MPPNAQAAVQEGTAIARNVLTVYSGKDLEPFDYKPLGQLVERHLEDRVLVDGNRTIAFQKPI